MNQLTTTDPKDEKFKQITAEFTAALDKIRADNPKPEDVKAFSRVVETYPEMWRVLGDLAHRTQRELIDDMRVGPSIKASLRVGVKELGKELSRPNDTALERMVIDQVILCWLRVHETEMYWNTAHSKSIQFTQSDHWDRKLTAAQHRYLRAIESLARVRKLARVTIKVQVEQTARRQLEQPYKVIEQGRG